MKVNKLPDLIEEDISRFWLNVNILNQDECWEWKLSKALPPGLPYGRFKVSGKMVYAHRVSFFLINGKEPEVVRHTCDNPPCCNPFHLLGGTKFDNEKDKYDRGRDRHVVSEFQGRSVLTYELAEIIRRRRLSGEKGIDLAREFEVSPQTISNVFRNKHYTTLVYTPKVSRH